MAHLASDVPGVAIGSSVILMLITTVGSGMLAELGLFEDDENVGESCSGETGFLTGLSGRRTQSGRSG